MSMRPDLLPASLMSGDWLSHILFTIGNRPVPVGLFLAAVAAVLTILVLIAAIASSRRRAFLLDETQAQLALLMSSQAELGGRLAAMAEHLGARQGDVMAMVNQRLDQVSGRVGQTLADTTRATQESLARLQERLAVIDSAQANITALAGEMNQLQAVLNNKQSRGAFGEARMAAIIADGLPNGAYSLQPTLSNGARPDCLIRMPNNAPPLVVDAKFPLEAWHAIRAADTPERAKIAMQAFRRDVETHIRAIAEKYRIAGETQDMAFLFVPSESVFAEIHEKHEVLVTRAQRLRVVIVSPSLLMLSIQVIQSVLRDHRMREQAHLVQAEVGRMMEDLARLDDRVRKLASHFSMVNRDVDEILVSTAKLARRGEKIGEFDLVEDSGERQVHAAE